LDVYDTAGIGKSRKTLLECVEGDRKDLGLKVKDLSNREKNREEIFG